MAGYSIALITYLIRWGWNISEVNKVSVHLHESMGLEEESPFTIK